MDIGDIRLTNMLALLKSRSLSHAEFARQVKSNSGYISQMVNRWEGRRMGSHFARRIEKAFGLERGWMDNDHSKPGHMVETGMHRSLSETALLIGEKLDRLSPASQAQVRGLIERLDTLEHGQAKKSRKRGR